MNYAEVEFLIRLLIETQEMKSNAIHRLTNEDAINRIKSDIILIEKTINYLRTARVC
jgi:hypothetical protein